MRYTNLRLLTYLLTSPLFSLPVLVPSLLLFYPPLPFPSFPSVPSLRSRAPKIQLGDLGEHCKLLPLAGSGAELQPKLNLVDILP